MEYWQQLLTVCTLVFFAGFVDSVAGGGGIISLPAYYVAGLPPHMALGSNKFSSVFGTSVSSARFLKNRKVDVKAALTAAVCALAGAALGARLALYASDVYFQYILMVSLPVLAVFIIKNKKISDERTKELPRVRVLALSAAAGAVIGCYDGFFGPGAGTFLIIAFNAVIGYDVLTASGNAKIVNFASNLASVITFALSGNIMFTLAGPAAAASILGNFIGSRLAIKNGARLIRPAFVFVLALLLIKIAVDVFA